MTDNKNSTLPKQQYRVVVELDAPIEKCFDAGTAEVAMMHWVPSPKSIVYDHSKAAEPYGAGSERLVTLKSGMSLVEKIHTSNKPTFLSYTIPSFGTVGDLLLKNYQGHMTFEAISANKTRLTWVGHFDCQGLQKIAEPLTRVIMKTLISTMANNLKKYFAAKPA